MPAYFITWDFRSDSDFSEAEEHKTTCLEQGFVDFRWSIGVRKQLEIGSDLIMVRQGLPPKGIVGIGKSTSSPFQDVHYRDESKAANYVYARWKGFSVNPIIQPGSLPKEVEDSINWFMRSSGQVVEEKAAAYIISEFLRRWVLRDEVSGHALTHIELSEERKLLSDLNLSETERNAIVQARVGQGLFRKRVEELQKSCCVTGVESKFLLRASHIKPWRLCDNAERLDGYNGLLLAPHIDHLFDKCLLSFSNDGEVLFSPTLDLRELQRLGLKASMRVEAFEKNYHPFLSFHRSSLFLG